MKLIFQKVTENRIICISRCGLQKLIICDNLSGDKLFTILAFSVFCCPWFERFLLLTSFSALANSIRLSIDDHYIRFLICS